MKVLRWVTFYYDDNVIHVYDSLNRNYVTDDQLKFLKQLFFPFDFSIIYHPVQEQTNDKDCGVFAIAFAVELVFEGDPSNKKFLVPQMRPHLLDMLNNRTLMTFPTLENKYWILLSEKIF